MGIWSVPLGVYCEGAGGAPIDGKGVRLRFEKGTPSARRTRRLEWHDTGVAQGEDHSFESSIMRTCDTAKIYGYLEDGEFDAWDAYFDALMEQNPGLQLAEAHFFCEDYNMPYFIKKERGRQTEWFLVAKGNLVCYTLEPVEGDEPERCLKFHADRYERMFREDREVLSMLAEGELTSIKYNARRRGAPVDFLNNMF